MASFADGNNRPCCAPRRRWGDDVKGLAKIILQSQFYRRITSGDGAYGLVFIWRAIGFDFRMDALQKASVLNFMQKGRKKIIPKHHNILEAVFNGHTKKLAFHTKVPLLIIH